MRDRPLDGLVRKQRGNRDLVRGREDLGQVARRGQGSGDDTDAALA